MSNYEVWIRARDPKTMALVASVKVIESPDRLAAEAMIEAAMYDFADVVRELRAIWPDALVSTEMVMPILDAAAPVLTQRQVSAAARRMCDASAAVCNLDKDINWSTYGEHFITDLVIALAAAGVKVAP